MRGPSAVPFAYPGPFLLIKFIQSVSKNRIPINLKRTRVSKTGVIPGVGGEGEGVRPMFSGVKSDSYGVIFSTLDIAMNIIGERGWGHGSSPALPYHGKGHV